MREVGVHLLVGFRFYRRVVLGVFIVLRDGSDPARKRDESISACTCVVDLHHAEIADDLIAKELQDPMSASHVHWIWTYDGDTERKRGSHKKRESDPVPIQKRLL